MLQARAVLLLALLVAGPACGGAPVRPSGSPAPVPPVQVRLVTDEADAVLAILSRMHARLPVREADWERLTSSEGYVRLKQRQTAIRELFPEAPAFDDARFRGFVMSDSLVRIADALAGTLHQWEQADVEASARRVLAYLPPTARIRARIYPVIKPGGNSFVFEARTDPAIFLSLDPAVAAPKFENTLSHELHHIGFGTSCPTAETAAETARLPPGVQRALEWIGAFGEGFAMLAAAGGPEVHPHAVSSPIERAEWDRTMARYNEDLTRVEAFLLAVAEDRLSQESQNETGTSFFGIQGPWYTVGWRMAVTIERQSGRARLIEAMCDPRQLLAAYNSAAEAINRTAPEPLALWAAALIEKLGGRP